MSRWSPICGSRNRTPLPSSERPEPILGRTAFQSEALTRVASTSATFQLIGAATRKLWVFNGTRQVSSPQTEHRFLGFSMSLAGPVELCGIEIGDLIRKPCRAACRRPFRPQAPLACVLLLRPIPECLPDRVLGPTNVIAVECRFVARSVVDLALSKPGHCDFWFAECIA